jgi:hypothetical protein
MVARHLRRRWCFVECQTVKLGGAPAKVHEWVHEHNLYLLGQLCFWWVQKLLLYSWWVHCIFGGSKVFVVFLVGHRA